MKNLSFEVAKVVGTPGENRWSQVYNFTPLEKDKKQKFGTLVLALSISLPKEQQAEVGREILQRLHEEYYGSQLDSVLDRQKKAIEKVADEFPGLEVVAGVQMENILYLALLGEGEVWLKRGNVLGRLFKGGKEVLSGSGFLKNEDLVVLGTGSFFRIAGEGVLRPALEAGVSGAVESLAPLVCSQPSEDVAAVIFQIQEENEAEEILETEAVESETIKALETPGIVANFVTKVRGKIPRFFLGAIYVRRSDIQERHKRTFLAIAVILILLMLVSLFFGARKRGDEEKLERYNQIYQEAVLLFDQGDGLVSLNPAQAREMLSKAKDKVFDLEKTGIETSRTSELRAKVEGALVKVFQEYRFDNLPVFLDLTLAASDGKGDFLALSGQSLAVLEKGKNRIFTSDIEKKSIEILAGGDTFSGTELITGSQDSFWVLENEGLASLLPKGRKVEKGKIKSDEGWGKIASLRLFNGNIYLLDTDKDQVWRYGATESGYGSRQKWLKKEPDFSNVVSMSIDGAIWLLAKDGKILKFVQGELAGFSSAGLIKPFLDPIVLYTDENSNNLYILDQGNQRVVVLAKTGEYQSEYFWEGMKDVSDMVVSEGAKKIFLLSGSKIYSIDIK